MILELKISSGVYLRGLLMDNWIASSKRGRGCFFG